MTTLVALATKDALVMGCDSLGTTTRQMIDPMDLWKFFDSDNEFILKLDKDGKPLIKSFKDIYSESQPIASEHMTHMTKLFSLEPLKTGVMITGITSIGKRTVRSLIEEFKNKKAKSIKRLKEYSVNDVAEKLKKHILTYYEKEYVEEKTQPDLELIIGGYGSKDEIPSIFRIKLPAKEIKQQLEKGDFGIVFGGQMREIQRIVFGTDNWNTLRLSRRHIVLLRKYRDGINKLLKKNGIDFEIPDVTIEEIKKGKLDIFADGWDLEGFDANWGNFSEQNAIECVDFFVNIMTKSQQFSSGMPTVGGNVHIALITKDKFQFISREEYFHAGHYVPKHQK